MFAPDQPYNDLPDLHPARELETPAILKAAIEAHRALAELKGRGDLLPDQSVLVSTLTLQEAQLSSEIEGIVTTTDRLYRALANTSDTTNDAHTKEVLSYRDAMWSGVAGMREGRPLSTAMFEKLASTILGHETAVRAFSGTALQNE